jgi:hypothetical protein
MTRRALTLLLAGLAIHTGVADAYVIQGSAWPDSTLTYYPAAYGSATDRAARLINHVAVGVQLRRAPRSSADVVVRYGGSPCEGSADVGFQRFRPEIVELGRGCSRGLVTLTAVHEFGHILGLGHVTGRCARMNPAFDKSGTPSYCAERSLAHWLAHPFTSDDLRGLRRLYG